MSLTIEEPPLTPPPDENLEGGLTPDQLAELASNPEMRERVRAEVYRRLKNDARKANFLTFRWLLPADDEDKADAFDGLMGCCWLATKKRLPHGLFPRGYPETYFGEIENDDGSIAKRAGGVAEETREAVKDALVDCLYDLRTLPVPEVILTALYGGFHTDVDVGNALRRKVREESRYLCQYGQDAVTNWTKGELTLFEVLPDAGPRTNPYNDVVEVILPERPQIVEELGKEGWEVLMQIVELADNDLLPQSKRARQRAITEVFETVYGVNPRQARTHKSRFLAAVEAAASDGKPIFENIAKLLEWLGCWDGEKP